MHPLTTLKTKLFACIIIVLCFYFDNARAQSAGSLQQPAAAYKINFTWLGDTVNAKWEPYSALLIPVHLPGCPKQFYMQFDMGAPHTLFYKNGLKAIKAKYFNSVPAIDTSSKIHGLTFLLANQKVSTQEISVKDFGDSNISWDNKNTVVIGTLGVDLIANKTVIINYPERQLEVCDSIPPGINAKVKLSSFMFIQGSILLPALVRGKQSLLYFDTGSSAFELLTSKETCAALAAPNAIPVSYPVKSWGRMLTANTVATADSLVIASCKLPVKFATYIEGASDTQIQQMMKMGIGGMTGNKLFLNSILVLDTRNKKFGVVSK
ncbi:hypothetical protein KXD93_28435 [Mucilaginibacter sp. BJC16-A38]|uniref:hypothetical protein n=1 Tax=Mucilaginibacter phenanthrenivorans TaxID=1234842 RepID=UPI0021584775|nr:hypothetical protein [Mucilaginibacter phenanthrenivorans]MCR8561616.1 hypothetical protein [Mucilaginibacter phenanthrenivorans]